MSKVGIKKVEIGQILGSKLFKIFELKICLKFGLKVKILAKRPELAKSVQIFGLKSLKFVKKLFLSSNFGI